MCVPHGSHLSELLRTYAGFQKLAADSLVHPNRLGNLLHVSSGGLTQGADAVDAADSLRQEGVSCLKHTQTVSTVWFKLPCWRSDMTLDTKVNI